MDTGDDEGITGLYVAAMNNHVDVIGYVQRRVPFFLSFFCDLNDAVSFLFSFVFYLFISAKFSEVNVDLASFL